MARNEEHKEEEIIEAIQKSEGVVAAAANILKCTSKTIYNYCNKYPKIKEILTEFQDNRREDELDVTENMLMKNVRAGKEASIFFKLKTQGQSRGYIEKQRHEITGGPGEPLTVKVTIDE